MKSPAVFNVLRGPWIFPLLPDAFCRRQRSALDQRGVMFGSLDRRLLEDAFHVTTVVALQREKSFFIADSEHVTVSECAGRE